MGMGELKLQKMVYATAVLDGDLPIVWIWYCIPGSKEHHEQLQNWKLSFQNKLQVAMIVKCLQAKAKLNAPKAEHLLCLTLSKKQANDEIVVGYDLYYSILNAYG
jgi:hypothetical protein